MDRLRRRLPLLLGLILLIAHSAAAATKPGTLPWTVVPTRYAIDLRPDLAAALVAGTEIVDIDVRRPTRRVVLNAVAMALSAATLVGDAGASAAIALDEQAETATLSFPQPLRRGPHRLRIAFTAHVNTFGRGLFAIDYPTAAGRKRMLATQLEPADARRVFPSWDEPAFKARFALTVTVPRNFLAVSNMPVAHEAPAGPGEKRVRFATTPVMSSYLLVLVAGELERVSGVVDGVRVGVVTQAGKSAEARYALASALRLLAYYDRYFKIRYALPKLDLITIPGLFTGAMENWGGIVFYEPLLLYDPRTSPQGARRSIFTVLAHEMSHQWFGDLVTMAWWDDLWLNEGFASWMQDKAADAFNPGWHVWLNSAGATQSAMREDARRTTHPIEQPIADASEARTAFDSITYRKGRALIRQLEAYVGERAFRAGIRRYIAAHRYGNATTAELWQALQAETGKPIAAIARGFTTQPGFPLIDSDLRCVDGRQRLRLAQERFTIDDPRPHRERWQVPIVLGPPARVVLLRDKRAEIGAGRCGDLVKLNLGAVGFYRVRYDDKSETALAAAMERLPAIDRVNLLDDGWALVEAGQIAPGRYLDLVDGAQGDVTRAVWNAVLGALDRIEFLERGRAQRAAFAARARAWLAPVFAPLGWDPVKGEDADRALLRARLIGALGDFGDPAILAEARRRFAAFRHDPASLRPGLRPVVMHLVGRDADRDDWEALLALARATTDTEERARYLSALAAARDPDLARRTLALALGGGLPANLAEHLVYAVAGSGEHPDLAWAFVKENYAALAAQQGPSFGDEVAAGLFRNFSDRAHADELAGFAPQHETPAGRIAATRAAAAIAINADFIAHQLPEIEAWIRDHPVLGSPPQRTRDGEHG